MKKLLKLKNWVTVPEAASHLSTLFGEDVAEADILRFALDGRLTLSIYFVNAVIGQRGKIVLADAERIFPPSDDGQYRIQEINLHDGRVISFEPDLTLGTSGVWDLAMLGVGRSEIERKYHLLTGGPALPLSDDTFLDDLLISRPDGTILPADTVLVIRTSALRDLAALVSEPESGTERPVAQRERTTLLVIIAPWRSSPRLMSPSPQLLPLR